MDTKKDGEKASFVYGIKGDEIPLKKTLVSTKGATVSALKREFFQKKSLFFQIISVKPLTIPFGCVIMVLVKVGFAISKRKPRCKNGR